MDSSNTPETTRTTRPWPFPWYYATRIAGLSMLGFGVLVDHTPERGTIILTGAGLLGIDKVARSEKNGTGSGGSAKE